MLAVKLPSHLLGTYVKGIFRFSGQLHVYIMILTRMFDVIRILSLCLIQRLTILYMPKPKTPYCVFLWLLYSFPWSVPVASMPWLSALRCTTGQVDLGRLCRRVTVLDTNSFRCCVSERNPPVSCRYTVNEGGHYLACERQLWALGDLLTTQQSCLRSPGNHNPRIQTSASWSSSSIDFSLPWHVLL